MRNDFISFDASIKKNKLGIGIFDNIGCKYFTYFTDIDKDCSLTAETIALGCALKYASKTKRKVLNLYTDNKTLANHGIPKQFQHLVEGKTVSLTWVPREFNREADHASKGAQGFHRGSSPTIRDFTSPSPVAPRPMIEIKAEPGSIRAHFQNQGFKAKIKLLKRVSESREQNEMVRLIESGEKGDYKFQLYNGNSGLINLAKLVYTIFDDQELTTYARNRMKKSFSSANIKRIRLSKSQFKTLVINNI